MSKVYDTIDVNGHQQQRTAFTPRSAAIATAGTDQIEYVGGDANYLYYSVRGSQVTSVAVSRHPVDDDG